MDDLSSAVEDIYPLTPVQAGLLFHALLEPGSRAYVNQYVFSLRGRVDAAAMQGAWQRVVEQHPILRTGFAWEGMDVPLQVVRHRARLRWESSDWRGCTEEVLGERRERYLETERARGFALLEPPLMRLALLQMDDDRFDLVWTFEHLVLDGWSLSLVLRDVFTVYEAVLLHREAAVRPCRPFRDYVAWLERQDLSRAEAYWRETLEGFTAPTPLEIVRSGGAGGTVAHVEHRLSTGATEALLSAARRHRTTTNTIVQGAWGLLLSRYSGEEDVVFGATVSGRSPELHGMEEMVGLFINTLPVRLRVEGEARADEWLGRLRAQQVKAQRYEHSPLQDVQGWSAVPAGVPLFESILVFENHPTWEGGGGESGFSVEEWKVYGGSHYPLALAVLPGERLELRLEYDARRVEADAAGRMVGHLETVMEALVEDLGRSLDEVPLLREEERAQVLADGRGETRPFPREALVHELIAARAAAWPDAPAVVCGGRVLSYRQLDLRAGRLAARLRAHGVGAEAPVAIFLDRSAELAVSLLAVLKAGGAFVPLDPEYPRERLRYLLDDTRAAVILTRASLASTLPASAAGVLSVDTEVNAGEALPTPRVGSDTLAYLCYTSGSTGRPKAAMVSHRSLLCYAEAMRERMGLTPADRVLQFASPAFDVMIEEVFPTWLSGACVVFPEAELLGSPRELLRVVGAEGVSVIELPTAFWHEWVRTVVEERLSPPPSLRLVLLGGERVLGERLAQWVGLELPLLHVFGLTETTVTTTTLRLEAGEDGSRRLNLPVGVPLANAVVHVLDRRWEPVPVGVPGELYVAGEAVARGYWGRPSLTAERFVPDPFAQEGGGRLYRTGDRVRRLPGGELEFLGRMDQQVKVRGHRIEPVEIEAVLAEHPAVREVVVLAREFGPGDLRLVAYIAAEHDDTLPEAVLRAWLRERLPEHMVPAALVTLERLPLTANGKVDRAALPTPFATRRPSGDTASTLTPTERLVAGIWAEILGAEQVRTDDSFFDIGGNSLLLLRVQSRLAEALGREVPLVELLHHRSLGVLAAHLDAGSDPVPPRREAPRAERTGASAGDIAIVGMVGRFPRARGLDEFWRNLREGVDCISTFSDDELAASGVSTGLMRRPDYVRARGVLDEADRFDAEFFGISPREASVMNPQHRLMLECAWEALESAGYDPETFDGRVGVFTGADLNRYWVEVLSHRATRAAAGEMQVNLGNSNAFLPTRISYRLNLRGPSLNVETACSSSLVAIHLGIRSLLAGESDMVVAGGVSVSVPQKAGYLFHEGGTSSPTGRCRSYDAAARGAVGGEGIGVVVLKRLEDALADGDTIHAVIRGSAVNNDGAAKIGYAAPGRDGQAEVIEEALAMAGVEPETISYVEGHGSATELGDPVEVAALTRAFRSRTGKRQFCALGSVKSNIGHLDTASGVAGLIKTVLALQHREIPPSLHFEQPNPRIDFAASPFFVNAELRSWEVDGPPRRAGVSSFGIGGTNAHVVLEESPSMEPSAPSRPWQLLVLSARTPAALEAATDRLVEHLKARPEQSFADVCHTLRVGRKRFRERRVVVCRDREDAVAVLETRDPRRLLTLAGEREGRPVAFLLPGLGDHYAGMARGLYEAEPVFRREVDRCAEILEPLLGLDLRGVLFPEAGMSEPGPAPETDLRRMLGRGGDADLTGHPLGRTELVQPAVFVTGYALARCWMEWGVRPASMIGHSLGEYVAATLAGVFRLEDALALVAERARLIGELPAGAMLAVPFDPAEVAPLLRGGLALAAHNAPGLCTVSGRAEEVYELERELADHGVVCRRLAASHAFHSPMMDLVAERLAERVRGLRLAVPEIPFMSDVTGTWITAEEAVSPDYWTRHLCRTVRFAEGMEEVLRGDHLFLEVGPGRTLGTFALQAGVEESAVFASLRHAYTRRPDQAFLLETLGRLWMAGARVDWAGFAGEERRRRVPLPTYPFERQRFWVERPAPASARKRRGAGRSAEGLWVPGWRRTAPPVAENGAGQWLVLLDWDGVGEQLARRLAAAGRRVATADPAEDIPVLLDTLAASGRLPDRVVDVRPLTRGTSPLVVMALARSLSEATDARIRLVVVTRGAYDVTGGDALDPAAACIHGLCETIPREHPSVACRTVDLPSGDPPLDALVAEVAGPADDAVVALRGASRWVRIWERVRTPAVSARVLGGTYLFLGSRGPTAPLAEELAGSAGVAVRFADMGWGDGDALRALLREAGCAPVGVVYTPEGGAEEEGLRRVAVELAALEDALAGVPLRFCLLQGVASEPAAAALLEAVAGRRRLGNGDPWTAVRWGAAAPAADDLERVLSHVLGVSAEPQLVVSRRNPCARPVLPPREEPAEAGAAPRYGRPVLAGEYVAPGTETERKVAAVWEELLLIGQIGVHDDFFSLGGHSILATQILGRLRQTLRVEVTLRQVFENPTIAGLAALVDALAPAGARREYPPIVPVPRDQPLVPSFGQERMWLVCTREPESPLYNVSDLQRMAGHLAPGALGRALAETICRHEVLRTAFRETGGALELVPVAAPDVSLCVVDLTRLPREERDPEMWRRLPESALRAIDLATAVRIRVHLFRLDEEEHALLRVLHHAVVDGWSSQVFWHDMAALYGAFARGLPSPLAEPEIQYADFAAWQRGWMRGETLDELLGFWTRELEGAPRFLDLPTDRPYPAVEDNRGSAMVFHVDRELTARLQSLAQREGATLYIALLAVYQLVLHRWTGQDDMLVGALVANRSHPQTHDLMGYFLNTVALRARMEGNPVFREHVARVREATLRADRHQDLPFDLLLQELRPERDAGRSPLVQTMFVLQQRIRHGAAPAVLPGLEVATVEIDPGTAKFEIGILADEMDGEITLLVEYQSSIFDRSTALRFAAHYRAALEAVAGDAGLRLSAVPVMAEEEIRQVLEEWNATAAGYPRGCVHELVEAQAARTPAACAVVSGGETLTYAGLEARSGQLARHLRGLGVGPEVRVGVCLERTPELVVALLAVLRAGGAYVPLDPDYPRERLGYMLEDAQVSLVLTSGALAGVLPAGTRTLALDAVRCEVEAGPGGAPETGVLPENLSHVIFTSGSTGRPKGVMIRHASTVVLMHWLRENVTDEERSSVLFSTSINFDVSVAEIFGTLAWGGSWCWWRTRWSWRAWARRWSTRAWCRARRRSCCARAGFPRACGR